MTTIEQREHLAARALRTGSGIFGGMFATLGAQLRGLAEQRVAIASTPAATSIGHPSELFARALGENSNRAMDWLTYAGQLASADERRYCAGRALLIDPACPVVRAEAARLRIG